MLRLLWLGPLLALSLARPAAAQAPVSPAAPAKPATPPAFVPDPALPRLTVSLSTANRTTYLQRAPQSADDRGYLGTTASYQAPSGFLASGYLNHSYAYTYLDEPFLNFGELSAGWQAVGNSSTYWSAQYTRLFSYDESTLVQTSLSNDLSGTVTHYFSLLTASASADFFFGRDNDFILTFDASHPFALPVLARDTLTIEPTVEFGAGSQHFYANSLGQTITVQKKKRTTTTVVDVPSTPGFAALGYTLSVPITLSAGRFSFAATPSYLIPLNIPTGGDGRSFFYGTLTLSRTFW